MDYLTQHEAITLGTFLICAVLALLYFLYIFTTTDDIKKD